VPEVRTKIGGGLIPLYHFDVGMAAAQFRFDTSQLTAGSFIAKIFLFI
jgi:hypothetical protein